MAWKRPPGFGITSRAVPPCGWIPAARSWSGTPTYAELGINRLWGIHLTGVRLWGMEPPRSGVYYPRSTGEFQAWFRTDADCLDYLEWLRWPGGFTCPDCGHAGGWRL